MHWFWCLFSIGISISMRGWNRRNGCLICSGFIRFNALAFFAISIARLHVTCSENRRVCAFAQQRHKGGIKHDQTDHQKATRAHQLRFSEPQYKRTKGKDANTQNQRHQLDRKRRSQRKNSQNRAHNSVTKQAAQTKAMGLQPNLTWF